MTNQVNNGSVSDSGIPFYDPDTFKMWMGWTEVSMGKPYHEDYDKWPVPHQRNYEFGRACASVAKGRMGYVPAWQVTSKATSILIPHPEVELAIEQEAEYQLRDAL